MLFIREAGTRSQANLPLILDTSIFLFWFCHMTVVDSTSYSAGQESRKPFTLMAWWGTGSPVPSLVHLSWFLGQSLLPAAAPKGSLFVPCRFFILKHKSSLAALWNSAPFILPWVRQNGGAGAVSLCTCSVFMCKVQICASAEAQSSLSCTSLPCWFAHGGSATSDNKTRFSGTVWMKPSGILVLVWYCSCTGKWKRKNKLYPLKMNIRLEKVYRFFLKVYFYWQSL